MALMLLKIIGMLSAVIIAMGVYKGILENEAVHHRDRLLWGPFVGFLQWACFAVALFVVSALMFGLRTPFHAVVAATIAVVAFVASMLIWLYYYLAMAASEKE